MSPAPQPHVLLYVGSHTYALDVANVRRVTQWSPADGRAEHVHDLGALTGDRPDPRAPRRIVHVELEGTAAGLVVDDVDLAPVANPRVRILRPERLAATLAAAA